MADIIICPQVIYRIIRLEVQGNHVIDIAIFKSCLIAVNIISILLTDYLHIFIKHRRMQDIIMIKQADILSGCHLVTFIGITGDALVFFQLHIFDTRIILRIIHTHFADILMLCIRTVCQTQFPLLIGLIRDGFNHLSQKLFRCIIKRY